MAAYLCKLRKPVNYSSKQFIAFIGRNAVPELNLVNASGRSSGDLMTVKTFLQTALVCCSLSFGVATQAGVIYDNGDIFPLVQGANFSEGHYRLADDFSLAADEALRSVQFWGSHWVSGTSPSVEQFTLSVYDSQAGEMGNLLATSSLSLIEKLDTGYNHNNVQSADIWSFTMDLTSEILLSAGHYFLSIWSEDNPGTSFAWQRSSASGMSYHSYDSGLSWTTGGTGNNAWNISNEFAGSVVDVPEPGSVALICLGLIGLAAARRKAS